ncbi:hypothetical protein RvY_00211-1 [Ramazzottius varieornatus]|uniref:Major facilitator superfamily (MFS) profile domain-containing protein n=1 Tax=Ramazzottius varieornatus TaxID=947166 RepID=A0A1D1ULX0_RAMVA|nr:hypothetical protein RvY_00211-1 [Ramazzottius varieornatus]
MLAAGRLINGFGAGVCASIATIYLTEIAPLSLRGLFGIIRGVCLFGGQLCAQVLGHPSILGTSTLWPYLFGFGLLPALMQFVLLPFCPDSPCYLYLDRDSTKKGTKALKRLRGDLVFEIELAELKNKQEFDAEANESVSVAGLFKDPFLRHCILIAVIMNMGTELVGYSAILFYSTSVFLGSGMGQSAAVTATIGTGILMLVACIIVATFIDKVGRRIVLLVGYVGMLVVTSAITVFIVLFETFVEKESEGKGDDEASKKNNPYIWTTYASAACVYLFLVCYSVGPGIVPSVLASEMFTQGSRTAAVCFSIALSALAAFFVTVLFPLASSAIGGYTFLVFVGLQVFYIFYAYFNVLETKGKESEEIVKDIRTQWERKKKS